MPHFRPLGRRLRLNSTLDGAGNPKPYEIPSKILEPNPRRKFLYVENVGGDADPLRLTGEGSPKRGSGDDTLGLDSDSFAFAREENPLMIEYAGPLNGLMDAIPTRINEGFYFGELVDDVDVPDQGTLNFLTQQYGTAHLPGQAGPLFQPSKIYEAKPGVRFLFIMARLGTLRLTNTGSQVSSVQSFEIPNFFPLLWRHPYVPSRSLFAFDTAAGGRLDVAVGYA